MDAVPGPNTRTPTHEADGMTVGEAGQQQIGPGGRVSVTPLHLHC